MTKKTIHVEVEDTRYQHQNALVNICIHPRVHYLIKQLHEEYKHCERSAICKTEKVGNTYQVTDIFFPEQENSATLTTMTEKGKEDLLNYLVETQPREMGNWNLRLHSHH